MCFIFYLVQHSVQRKVIPNRNHFTIVRDLTANKDDDAMREITSFIQSLESDGSHPSPVL